MKLLSSLLADDEDDPEDEEEADTPGESQQSQRGQQSKVVSQQFRDAYACHLYMIFMAMFFMESEAKIGSSLKATKSSKRSDQDSDEVNKMRAACAGSMLLAAQTMNENRHKLWRRGVPDEDVVMLPCKIAYQMLENAKGVLARQAASGDAALGMIAATFDSSEALAGTILAAIMDMLHSYEHMAPLCAELCCMVSETPNNRLAVELIREFGRIDTGAHGAIENSRASGIKFVAPFIHELALRRPRIVLAHVSHVLPHLDSDPYFLRSAIAMALGAIVEHIGKSLQPDQQQEEDSATTREISQEDSASYRENMEKSRSALLNVLETRVRDVNSFTRSAVLKAWISLAQSGTLPVEWVIPCTELAIDRLKDKTILARKQALQVSQQFTLYNAE